MLRCAVSVPNIVSQILYTLTSYEEQHAVSVPLISRIPSSYFSFREQRAPLVANYIMPTLLRPHLHKEDKLPPAAKALSHQHSQYPAHFSHLILKHSKVKKTMHLTTLLAPLLLSSLASILANPITPPDENNALSKRGLLGEKCGDSLSPPQPLEDWSVTCSTDDRSVVSLIHTHGSFLIIPYPTSLADTGSS